MPRRTFVTIGQLRSVFLLVAAVLVPHAIAACPAGSVQGLSAEACYKIYNDATDWNSAEALCHEKDGGRLASEVLRALRTRLTVSRSTPAPVNGTTKSAPPKKPFVCLIEDNSQASHCADEWTYNDATKLCYYVVGTIRDITADTWPTAQRWCSGVNGNLVTIHDAATNDDVLRYARDAGFNNNHFPIGLKYEQKTKAWTWRDGSAMVFTNWAPGFPVDERDQYGHGKDYAYMWMYGGNASLWINDWKETYQVTLVLCQRPPQA